MRVVGVDPGTHVTGYGIVDISGGRPSVLEAGEIAPRKTCPLPQRILTIYSRMADLLEQYNPQVMVLEKLYAHGQRPTTSGIMGHARGVICLVCAQRNLELVEYSVKRVRKSVTGNGNATKLQTRRMVAHLLNIKEERLTLDASDALALAVGHARMAPVKT
jgi:crossover junction endodeoxyribonuclease RuvC